LGGVGETDSAEPPRVIPAARRVCAVPAPAANHILAGCAHLLRGNRFATPAGASLDSGKMPRKNKSCGNLGNRCAAIAQQIWESDTT
jgi:hypothetical protein